MRKLLPTHYLLLALLAMPALHLVAPLGAAMPWALRVLGILPMAAGIALNLAADRALSRAQTTVKPFQESAALVTDGAFRISRNPMYLGFLLIAAGIAALLGSLAPWAVMPLLALTLHRVFVVPEERMLAETFGRDWLVYRARVRRWL